MSKSRKLILVVIMALVVIGLFSMIAFLLKVVLIPFLPELLQNWVFLFVSALILSITILAGFSQITGYSLRDYSFHKKTKSLSKSIEKDVETITYVSGNHNAKGVGKVTGLDIQSPVIIKPGTKSTAEGTGIITATRISNNREDEQ